MAQFYTQFSNARVISESRNSRNAAAQAGLKAGEELRERENENNDPDKAYTDDASAPYDAINSADYAAENKVPGNEEDGAEDFAAIEDAAVAGVEDIAGEAPQESPF